jgi:PAS domain S-box-containing protein
MGAERNATVNPETNADRELCFLMLEDEPTDAAIIEEALRESGFRFTARRVETRANFVDALKAFSPDLVLADYSLPAFDAHGALQVAHELAPHVPVIIVTGALPDERAVELLTEGARDYILKDRLSRLGPAVRRALKDAQAEAALARNERYFRKLIEDGSDAFFVLDAEGKLAYRSPSGTQLTGWTDAEVLGRNVAEFIFPEDVPLAKKAIADAILQPSVVSHVELRMLHRDGSVRVAEAIGKNLLHDPDVGGVVVTVRDISQRKDAEVSLHRAHQGPADAQRLQ